MWVKIKNIEWRVQVYTPIINAHRNALFSASTHHADQMHKRKPKQHSLSHTHTHATHACHTYNIQIHIQHTHSHTPTQYNICIHTFGETKCPGTGWLHACEEAYRAA